MLVSLEAKNTFASLKSFFDKLEYVTEIGDPQ